MSKPQSDVVVIGAGAVGASIAYSLAVKGVNVQLLEQNEICSGTTSSTAAWLWLMDKRPDHYVSLGRLAWERYRTLEAELDADIEYRPTGGISVLKTEAEVAEAHRIAALQEKVGIDVSVLSPEEAHKAEPLLTRDLLGASYSSYCGHVNPFLLVNAYVQAAKRHGARVCPGTRVEGFKVERGSIKAIHTNNGTITPGLVICAAGVYSTRIGRMLGIRVPVYPQRGCCLVTERLPQVLRHVIIGARQTVSGSIVLGYFKEHVEDIDRRVSYTGMQQVAREALSILPGLAGVNIVRSYPGIRCLPDDGLPVLGPVSQIDNFWLAVSHSAILNSCIFGPMISDLVTGEKDVSSLDPYGYSRFAGGTA